MTKKNCLKLLVMLGVSFLIICLFIPSKVNATETAQEEIQEMINLIPKNMTINIPEVEYNEAEAIIREEINTAKKYRQPLWKGKNITDNWLFSCLTAKQAQYIGNIFGKFYR